MEYSKNSMSVEDIDTLFINTYCNNCNDAVFLEMYEPEAVILATCWPRRGDAMGQFIIKLLPIEIDYSYVIQYQYEIIML